MTNKQTINSRFKNKDLNFSFLKVTNCDFVDLKNANMINKMKKLCPFYLIFALLIFACNISVQVTSSSLQTTSSSPIPTAIPVVSESSSLSSFQQPDLSTTSDEPIVAIVGQDVFVSCVAKNLQNYTIIWRYSDDTHAPSADDSPADDTTTSSSSQSTTNNQNMNSSSTEMNSNGDLDSLLQIESVILTAGLQTVSSDDRFSVIRAHDTWLLRIKSAKLSDTGSYFCQTNSEPPIRVVRVLSVIPPAASSSSDPTDLSHDAKDDQSSESESLENVDHNFIDCCQSEFVPLKCQSLCELKTLATQYQSLSIVSDCFSYLPTISRCMLAGRNVTTCCNNRHVPNQCAPMCGSNGISRSDQTSDSSSSSLDNISLQDHYTCADYSAVVMSCAVEGVRNLPHQPESVMVEAISPDTLRVSWLKAPTLAANSTLADGYVIEVTKLSSFLDTTNSLSDSHHLNASSILPQTSQTSDELPKELSKLTLIDASNTAKLSALSVDETVFIRVPNNRGSSSASQTETSVSLTKLQPQTVYQIQVLAYNKRGVSQSSEAIRALTLSPSSSSTSSSSEGDTDEVQLPDTRKCCLDGGVKHKRCLDSLCDPVEADKASIADLMICAPWTNVTFSCMSSSVDHSECCKQRGVSDFCMPMCSGELKRLDFRHFRCLAHMSSFTNCILESHGALPSAPRRFSVSPITSTWAVLTWEPPRRRVKMTNYRVYWRKLRDNEATLGSNDTDLRTDSSGSSPFSRFFASEAATPPFLLDSLKPESVYESYVVAENKYGQSKSSSRFTFQTLIDKRKKKLAAQSAIGFDSSLGNTPTFENNAHSHGYNETHCCVSGGISRDCIKLCDYDMKVSDVSSLVSRCQPQMPVMLRCLAGSRNSVPCCRSRGVSESCLNVCAGLSEYSPLLIAMKCAPDFGKIIKCMDEGSRQIPGAPIDLHAIKTTQTGVELNWKPAIEDSLRSDIEYQVRYQLLPQTTSGDNQSNKSVSSLETELDFPVKTLLDGSNSHALVVPLHPLQHNSILTTNSTSAKLTNLSAGSRYSLYVMAQNSFGISLPSHVLVFSLPNEKDEQAAMEKQFANIGPPHSLEILHQDTESILLKWQAPLYLHSDAELEYKVFYKLVSGAGLNSNLSTNASSNSQSSELTTTTTATTLNAGKQPWLSMITKETSAQLRNLHYSSQYAILVIAISKERGVGGERQSHVSELMLASTARPIPPTVNEPMVIGRPIEGSNITLMCVALGQPTPQLSMFINGLLVQRKTQSYAIYHLINLVRGQLTITCLASNGHGKLFASSQSRLELSVRFAASAKARVNKVYANENALVKLTCDIAGFPRPTIEWSFTKSGAMDKKTLAPSDKISMLTAAQFEKPNEWTNTLILANVSMLDAGLYTCRARNGLPNGDSRDSIELILNSNKQITTDGKQQTSDKISATGAQQLAANTDLINCCKSQNVTSDCLNVCAGADGVDVELAFRSDNCINQLSSVMFCAADNADHTQCCRQRQVPSNCLRWCSGFKYNLPSICSLSAAADIAQCLSEGRLLLPGTPTNLRITLASRISGTSSGQPTITNESVSFIPERLLAIAAAASSPNQSQQQGTNSSLKMQAMFPKLMGQLAAGSMSESSSIRIATTSKQDVSSNDDNNSQSTISDPLLLEWEAPVKNRHLVQYYKVFWRAFGSRLLARSLTNATNLVLKNLDSSKTYEFIVKAANVHGSSVYSEPLVVKPANVITQLRAGGTFSAKITSDEGLQAKQSIWMRITLALSFGILFIVATLITVLFLEQRGHLQRFASSKSNSSRLSFANPSYVKEDSSIVLSSQDCFGGRTSNLSIDTRESANETPLEELNLASPSSISNKNYRDPLK